jgi:hypothetical protein
VLSTMATTKAEDGTTPVRETKEKKSKDLHHKN